MGHSSMHGEDTHRRTMHKNAKGSGKKNVECDLIENFSVFEERLVLFTLWEYMQIPDVSGGEHSQDRVI